MFSTSTTHKVHYTHMDLLEIMHTNSFVQYTPDHFYSQIILYHRTFYLTLSTKPLQTYPIISLTISCNYTVSRSRSTKISRSTTIFHWKNLVPPLGHFLVPSQTPPKSKGYLLEPPPPPFGGVTNKYRIIARLLNYSVNNIGHQ